MLVPMLAWMVALLLMPPGGVSSARVPCHMPASPTLMELVAYKECLEETQLESDVQSLALPNEPQASDIVSPVGNLPLVDQDRMTTSLGDIPLDEQGQWVDQNEGVDEMCGLLDEEACRLLLVTLNDLYWLTGAGDEIEQEEQDQQVGRVGRMRRSIQLSHSVKGLLAMPSEVRKYLTQQKRNNAKKVKKEQGRKHNLPRHNMSRWGRSALGEDDTSESDAISGPDGDGDGNAVRSRSKRAVLPKKHMLWMRMDPKLRQQLRKYSALRKQKNHIRHNNRWG